MEKLKKLNVSELIDLHGKCPKKDEAKIVTEIEERTGINISETENQSTEDKVMDWVFSIAIGVYLVVSIIAAVKIIKYLS